MVQHQIDMAESMARQATGLWNFKTPNNPFAVIRIADQYATTADYAVAANSGVNPGAAYQKVTVLSNVDTSLANLNQGLASSRRALYSSQQIIDGNNVAALQTVGQIRSAASAYENSISQLENDNTDSSGIQSEMAVLQRTANAQTIALHQQHDTNQLIAAMLDQQVAQSKIQRDGIADATNRSLENAQSMNVDSSMWNSVSTSLKGWHPASDASH